MTSTISTARPLRTDARRNRERLLAAALKVFAEEGAGAPLDHVARAAGVGNATMYRHFPSREALLEAVLDKVHGDLTDLARDLCDVTPAIDAVVQWLRAFVDTTRAYLHLAEPTVAAMADETSALYASCAAMRSVVAELIGRAQDAGELGADVDILDLCVQASGIAWATQRATDAAQASRMIDVVVNGLRPPAG